jgi:threonine-phosphate decarboxylase
MITGHGGDIFDAAEQIGCRPADIVDMSSNINPLGPMETLVDYLRGQLDTITRLPDVDARQCVERFAARHGLQPGNVLAGNGTTQFIYSLPQALSPRSVMIAGPTYADYADACSRYNLKVDYSLSEEKNGFRPNLESLERSAGRFDTVFLCNPNNPTGVLIPGEKIATLCRNHPHTLFVVDESYLPFVPQGRRQSLITDLPDNCIVLQSLSKIFRIPGLRIGFLVASEPLVDKFRPWLLPWSVNGLAQTAVAFLMQHEQEVAQYVDRSCEYVRSEREQLFQRLKRDTKADLYASETVFFLVRLPPATVAAAVKSALLRHRILIRDCTNFKGLSERYIRVSVKTAESNRLLAEKLIEELNR